ncbi:MAG TPA: hypothetical protein VL200_14065, partial [Lacunisphaera sp.]|nr:hypothetical protein [Lacunisphaera sp.]
MAIPIRGSQSVRLAALIGVLGLAAGCTQVNSASGPAKPALAPGGPTGAQVARVALGADISALDAPERGHWAPLPVYQENGVASDELTILAKHG